MMTLRDIRTDLKERLDMIEERGKAENTDYERKRKALDDEHSRQISELKLEWESIHRLLTIENRRLGVLIEVPTSQAPAMPLDEFFVQTVRTRGTATKADLRKAAEDHGYVQQGEGGRTVHSTLLNIVRGGRLSELSPELYGIPSNQAELEMVPFRRPQ